MTRQNDNVRVSVSVSRGRSLFIWGLLCTLAGLVFLVYVGASYAGSSGEIVMPLDDAYIHFQYAHVIAIGEPYQYNPGLPPTSGATSLLYPYLLSIGDLLGFHALQLGLWAMGIGALTLALSAWIVFRLGRLLGASWWLAALVSIGFELNGPTTWHYMSGMETGLTVLFTLYTVYALASERYWGTIAGAALLALIRPEGAILALLALAATVWRERVEIMRLMPLRKQTALVGARHALPLHNPQDTSVGTVMQSFGLPEPPLQGDVSDSEEDAQTSSSPPSSPPLHMMERGTGGEAAYLRPGWVWLCLLIPLVAFGIQPLVNLLLTGSVVASGNAAKSLFGIVPPDMSVIIGRIWDNFLRMWWEFFSADPSQVGVGAATMLLAILGVEALYAKRAFRPVTLVFLGAVFLGTAAVSTLDTAFWHFKRYQIPYMALLLILAIPGVALSRWQSRMWKAFTTALLLLVVATYILSFPIFLGYYTLNVGYVAVQPLPMARWIREHTPPDAVIAVHDTGSLRYIGERTTLDMVGLTTPGAAEAWRNGPGSVAEFLERKRPDYIASYGAGHGYGLGYFEGTGLYAEALARYSVELDPLHNVALAASTQGIYRPQWAAADRAYDPMLLPAITPYLDGMTVYDEIDVADVYSERVHNYQWRNDEPPGGFPTEVYQFPYIGCTSGDDCLVMDGGRRINGDERFTLSARPGEDMVLVTRLHPANAGTFDVFANDVLINERVVPAIPGGWLDVATYIPGELVTAQTRIHIVPRTAGNFYMPYQHWAFQGAAYTPGQPSGEPVSTFQDGAIGLYNYHTDDVTMDDDSRWLELNWFWWTDGSARGDYQIFVHVLNTDGANVAQADVRPGAGTLPPGNWLPGMFQETIRINVSELSPGLYQIALGLYDPMTNDRLVPTSGDEASRLIVDTIEIE